MTTKIIGAALAAALAFGGQASAEGVSGAYLSARQASILGDFGSAARFYSDALEHDTQKAELLERAALAYLSTGQLEQATAYGERLEAAGHKSQVAQMAIFATLAREGRYDEIIARIDAERGVGPLVDGLGLAWATFGAGDVPAALAAFDKTAEESALGRFALYHKALALAAVGDYEGADALMTDPQVASTVQTRRGIMARAEVLSQLGRNADALTLLDAAFGGEADPALEQLRAALAGDAAVAFDHVRDARDGLSEVFFTLAGILSNEADDDFTLTYARMSEFIRPDHTDAVLMVAELLSKLAQHDLAVKQYRKIQSDNPAFHAAELGRAGALRDSGRLDAAIEVLETLSVSHGSLPLVHATLGDTMRRQERFEEAIAAYDRAIELQGVPDNRAWFLFYVRAISHERLDNWTQAEADFRKALELNPKQPSVLNYLGYSLVQRKEKLDEALAMIELAVKERPQSGYIVDSLGWVLYKLGRYDEAVVHMERAAGLMPVDPVVNDHLGDVYWAVGREMEARFQWRRAASFVDYGSADEEVDVDRIRRKLEVGLDAVLAEEGAEPLQVANDEGVLTDAN